MTATILPPSSSARPRRRDVRLRALLMLLGGVAVLGTLVTWLPGRSVVVAQRDKPPALAPAKESAFEDLPAGSAGRQLASEELVETLPATATKDAQGQVADAILKRSAQSIQSKRYDEALTILNEARTSIQRYPESYLLVGKALEGKQDYETARDFYNAALDRNPMLAEAYWGMATTSEALGDLQTAIGGMRSFLHTVPDPDPFRLKVAQARSAIWEWEAKLGRGPWGPTKGVLWGVTPEEMRKDDRGVALMMPLPGTRKPDGTMKFEIKHQDKFEMFRK